MGFPWAPVCTLPEVLSSPQLRAREFLAPMDEAGDEIQQPCPPYLFLGRAAPIRSRGPASPGADNISIYRDELGFSEQELERLAATGVI
jgi:crotonobetainyl-CoA:carnitine CoA-transferase CaiB-like acyl-CoA transferase